MSFEVPVVRVGGQRRGWAVPAAVSAFIGLVVLAVVTGGPAPQPGGGIAAAATASPTLDQQPAGDGLARVVVAAPRTVRALPEAIDCRDMDDATCLRLARAAILVLPDDLPAVRDATVWRSLICNDNFDCPGRYLDGSVPLGSVVVRFVDDSPRAAINVVDWRYTASIRLGARAWVARWLPESG